MNKITIYIQRWNSYMMKYLWGNVCFSAFIYWITLLVVKEDVFIDGKATTSCLFAILMCNIWQGIFNSVSLFNNESSYIVDDINKFLPIRSYIIANFIIQFCLCLIESLICTSLFMIFFDYSNTGLILPHRNLEYILTFFLVLLSCDTLSLAAGILIKKINTIMSIIPIILIVQFLFSGCLFDLSGIGKVISKITTAKWGYEALGTISNVNSLSPVPGYEDAMFTYTKSHLCHCWLVLILIILACTMLAGLFLYFRMNKEDN